MRDASTDRFKTAAELGTVVWYISFGDLLTLLVCFFLVLTPWQKLTNVHNSERDPHLMNDGASAVAPGIALASKREAETQPLLAEIVIFGCQPSDGDCERREGDRIVEETRGLRANALKMSIRICERGAGRAAALEWIGSTIKGSEIGELPLKVELGDERDCEAKLLRPVTARAVGSVRVQ